MDAMFELTFDTPGTYAYLCRLHPTMRGDIAVHRLLLDAAKEPAAPGKPYALKGRAALPEGATVSIQAEGVEQTTATVGRDAARSPPRSRRPPPRATPPWPAPSPRRRSRCSCSTARSARTQRGRTILAKVTPGTAGATVVLQLKLKERFGWWPVKAAKTKADGTVRFTIARGRKVQARVLLTASDEATELARSATFRLR